MNELLKIVCLLIVWAHLGRSVYQHVNIDDDQYNVDENQDENGEEYSLHEFVVPKVELVEVPCELSFEGGRVCDCDFSSKVSTHYSQNYAQAKRILKQILCTLSKSKKSLL